MRVAVLTSTDIRHRYVARRLHEALDVVAVAYEQTGYTPAGAADDHLSEADRSIVRHHFQERARQEAWFFGHDADVLRSAGDDLKVRQLAPGTLNSDATRRFLVDAHPDLILVYGTNLIRAPLLSVFDGRLINLHLGLSPYYRGTATNFYPLVNEEPEYVGATVHRLDAGIDSGPIIGHARPRIEHGDMPHTIGCKALSAGLDRLIRAARDYAAGCMSVVPQWPVPNPRLYLRRDYRPEHVVRLYRLLEAGLMDRYLERADEVAPRVRLVD